MTSSPGETRGPCVQTLGSAPPSPDEEVEMQIQEDLLLVRKEDGSPGGFSQFATFPCSSPNALLRSGFSREQGAGGRGGTKHVTLRPRSGSPEQMERIRHWTAYKGEVGEDGSMKVVSKEEGLSTTPSSVGKGLLDLEVEER